MSLSVKPIKDFGRIKQIIEAGNLYVINNSDLGNRQSRGRIAMDIIDDHGESFGVVMQVTWLPVNLAHKCNPELFLKSKTFRELVGLNLVIVIETDHAERILRSEEAKAEVERVNKITSSYNQYMKLAMPTNDDGTISIATSNMPIEIAVNNNEKQFAEKTTDNAALKSLVEAYNGGQLDDANAIEQLIRLQPEPDELKLVAGLVLNTSGRFFEKIGDVISTGFTPNESLTAIP